MSYKILKDDKKFYQVMHPDGSKFTVPKGGLSKDMQDKINGLPKHYDGVMISPETERLAANDPMIEMRSQIPAGFGAQDVQPVVPETETNTVSMGIPQVEIPQVDAYAGQRISQAAGKELGAAQAAGQQAVEQEAVDYRAKLQDMSNRGQAIAQTKEDQGRLFKNMNTGNKVLAALSVALGGIGSGMTGKSNLALDVINKAIDRDIEAQKDDKNSLYNAYLQEYKNAELAHTATQTALLNKVQNAKDMYTSKITDAKMLMEGQKLGSELSMKQAELNAKGQNQMARSLLLPRAITGDLKPAEIQMLPKEDRELYIQGAGMATNADGAKKIRDTKANRDNLMQSLTRLDELKSKYGFGILRGEAATEAQALAQQITGMLREPILGPGTMQASEYERLQKLIPEDPSAFFSIAGNTEKRLDTIKDIVDNNYNNKLKSEGISPKARPKLSTGNQLTLNK